MTRAKGKKQVKMERKPLLIETPQGTRPITNIEMHRYVELCERVDWRVLAEHILPTYAELSITKGRDDRHMIYEMYSLSQYSDGSVLECRDMLTFTAQQVVDGEVTTSQQFPADLAKVIHGDLKRNAAAAIKNGTTTNRAPRVRL